jgi:hypothetical protein
VTRVARVALVPYSRAWSYDFTAVALHRHLADRFDLEVFYRDGLDRVRWADFDLVVDFWWRGVLHRKAGPKVAKQVSSHRWSQARWGSYSAQGLAGTHLNRNVAILVPSQRLEVELAPLTGSRPVLRCAKGFHPETFGDVGNRRGALAIGWAGNATAADKNLGLLVKAWPELHIAGGTLTQAEMPAFYNGVDVITCASDAEGDPRPLIEGMACGCFPVTVDVGIVPELVRHGDNGLIVERSVEAFAQAFAWCRDNVGLVRDAGRRNATEMLTSRTWAAVSRSWGDAFERAIARRTHNPPDPRHGRRPSTP